MAHWRNSDLRVSGNLTIENASPEGDQSWLSQPASQFRSSGHGEPAPPLVTLLPILKKFLKQLITMQDLPRFTATVVYLTFVTAFFASGPSSGET